ncbi:class II glutamine amidotransferase [Anaeromyxobacter paludicola]|uniref:Class II glutamine amidotransferase n=1 Tax=Anaeromyxobacter paludicola TaxID=2918171 RepID=A0ABN6N237_9BACT|nr:class II glutamine amidotransferase [Anaeromyxobacter paludicola]BDG07006.1 class II glutamine amidotransferase [Anaeromyxobacter paludicola]
MAAAVAVIQTDPSLLACQLRRLDPHVSLSEPGRAPDAYGFGYYSSGGVLIGKRPSGAPSLLRLSGLTGAIHSEALVAHARYATVGGLKDENTHPFRYRRWLFAQDGTVEGFAQVRPLLLAAVPDHLRRHVEGETDAEHVFVAFLDLLKKAGHELDDYDLEPAAAAQALARTVRQVDAWCREAGVQRTSALTLLATNGRILVAVRRGRPLHYALLEGIVPCALHDIDAATPESDPRLRAHRVVKAVCMASQLQQQNGFIEVPEGSAVAVSRALQVTVSPLGAAAGA